MSERNFIKNITSKDVNLSTTTIKTLIKTGNIEQFQLLCEKSDFIFPFLKEKIITNFIKLVNKEDLKTIFEFSKIYSFDFEELIVGSWVKFASEDLTDEILELFENGTVEQKAYCAKYFSRIQDPLALEFIKKEAKTDFQPLMTNCAQTLSIFKDVEVLNEMKNFALNSSDDFEKLNAYNFITAYGGSEQIKFVVENGFSSPFLVNILSNILDFNEIDYLKSFLDEKIMVRIFQVIIEEYPEDISLDTCYYWNLADYIKLIDSYKTNYSNNVLILAREKFAEFSQNDIYTFDFDKNVKTEIKNISEILNSLNLSACAYENFEDDFELSAILEVIKVLNLADYAEFLATLFNKMHDEKKAEIATVLKELKKIDLININTIEQIENENVKALIKSYL